MNGSTRIKAGVLVLALLGGAVACGDDSDSDSDEQEAEAGDDGSEGGSSEETAEGGVLEGALDGSLEGGTLDLYSGRDEDLIQPLVDDFEDATGIEVSPRYDDSADLALQIDQEADAGQGPDVFLSQSPGAVGFLAENDRLAELPEDVTSVVEPSNAGADGSWVGVSGRIRTLVYNTDDVDPEELPDSVLDLTADEWSGRVGVAPTNGSFQDFVTFLRSDLGDDEAEEWLEGMDDNDAQTYENNTAIVEAVARGEVEVGLVNHYYLFSMLDEDPDLPIENHFFPTGDLGSSMLSTAVSLLDGAEHSDEAIAFIEYLLSDAGQTYFAEETFEFPLAIGSEPAAELPSLDEVDVTHIDFTELGGELSETVDLIEESGLSR